MSTKDIDKGYKRIMSELAKAKRSEVVVGILEGQNDPDNPGTSIAEYATHNEFGTEDIPARPFMAMSFDENTSAINNDFKNQTRKMVGGEVTAKAALTIIGQKHAQRVQATITDRNILPALAPSTIASKRGSTKTLVDDGAMANAVQISIRGRSK